MKFSDRDLICLGIALGALSLYINFRMAMALAKVKQDADSLTSNVKDGPLGPVLGLLGLK